MSYTVVNILNQKSVTEFEEFANGFGAGPAVWRWLWEKYIGGEPRWITSDQGMKQIWGLLTEDKTDRHDKIVLTLTYDRCFVPIADLNEVSDACFLFHEQSYTGEWVNHWQKIGLAYQKMAKVKLNRFARGACITQTSAGDLWREGDPTMYERAFGVFEKVAR